MFFTLILLQTALYFALAEHSYDIKWLDVPLDHFTFSSNKTFKLRYLVTTKHHIKGGPVLVYTGDEADIELFAKNTGFIHDVASVLDSLVVFVEHRYYGQSMPFGNQSLRTPENMKYLSTSQALADFAYVIEELRKEYFKSMISNDTFPFVALGGSYGGMLAAWLRMKYPTSVCGAVAASAPIWYFSNQVPCEKFYQKVTDVFETYGGDECVDVIKMSWKIIRNLTKEEKGRLTLSKSWSLCHNISSTEIDKLVDWLSDIYVNLAMANYPYPSKFLQPLPAFPVRVFCNKLYGANTNDTRTLLEVLNQAFQIYTNYSGQLKCHDVNSSADDSRKRAWRYQVCTELVMPLCSTDADMFENAKWDLKRYSEKCYRDVGVWPWRPDWIVQEYGGKNLRYFSNIVFSNGLMDPWSVGGVLANVSSNILAVTIPRAAHHVDLRDSDLADDNFVVQARKFHIRAIRKFLNIN
ncbi:unnamed protein product [Acanthoscelides obtectus]|uniref:Lysosomal Pro-X carboxypeptidase n=1 Tax=Acanthoscelides obtectus TaxID=200917 RepID=A0A9P0LUY1_ACAOB|nr:unnamed protein product [Acanthoscelides obtectus]CAK1645111.1 Lysosomal Pro-X carboxypeptidase [Acanthoscelides obtectus]